MRVRRAAPTVVLMGLGALLALLAPTAAEAGRFAPARSTVTAPGGPTSRVDQVEPTAVESPDGDYLAFDLFLTLGEALAGDSMALRALSDPSVCIKARISNPTASSGSFFLAMDLPVDPFAGPYTVSATLRLDLEDADGDGEAVITGSGGRAPLMRAILVSDDTTLPAVLIPTDLGPERIDGAGVHSFEIGPIAGPVEPDRDVLSVLVFFDLSPGDRVTVQGRFIADLGTAVPVCAIPLLPGDADLDVDGVEDSADNCPATPNPTQSDLDGDGAGDVCDADADGDGESNADEVAHGTDPLDATSNRRRQRAILGPLELLLSE